VCVWGGARTAALWVALCADGPKRGTRCIIHKHADPTVVHTLPTKRCLPFVAPLQLTMLSPVPGEAPFTLACIIHHSRETPVVAVPFSVCLDGISRDNGKRRHIRAASYESHGCCQIMLGFMPVGVGSNSRRGVQQKPRAHLCQNKTEYHAVPRLLVTWPSLTLIAMETTSAVLADAPIIGW
jgi:hypothetical protein